MVNAIMKRDIQERGLDALVRNKGFSFTRTFVPYTSGEIGNYYVQSVAVTNKGDDYREAINSICDLINHVLLPGHYDVISGGESRDWDFSNPAAFSLGKAHAKIYKNGNIIGADVEGKRVVHVADLNNEGSSVRDIWLPSLTKAGGKLEKVFFYVDRLEDGVKVMKELSLDYNSVVPLDENAWDYLSKNYGNDIGLIGKVYDSIRERMKDKESWAKRMLLSEAGLETFAELSRTNSEKARKILDKGYPYLKDEIVDRLKHEHPDVPKLLFS